MPSFETSEARVDSLKWHTSLLLWDELRSRRFGDRFTGSKPFSAMMFSFFLMEECRGWATFDADRLSTTDSSNDKD
jgi:hypothetical protein